MPLHKIPLCSLKYVGDTHSGATFKYDTTSKVLKHKEKLFYKDKVVEIDKTRGDKLLYKYFYNIEKKNNEYLYKENPIMVKEFEKELKLHDREINKDKSMPLEDTDIIEFNKKKSMQLGQKECININIEVYTELQPRDSIDIHVETDKNLLEFRNIQLNKDNKCINLNIDRENLQLDKFESIYTNKITEKGLSKYQFIQSLKLEKNTGMEKHDYRFLNRIYFKEIDMYKLKFFEKYRDKYIDKDKYNFVDRVNFKKIDTIENPDMLKRIGITKILKSNIVNNLDSITIRRISKDYNIRLMHKILLKNIEKYKYIDCLDRINIKSIDKDKNKKYFYREGLKTIDKYYNRYLDREAIISIHKDNDKYLDYMPLINVYKQIEKDLLDLTIWDIYKEHDEQLQGTLMKNIYKVGNNNKFIEVAKRWWWLNPTDPMDKLIIPNKDYEKMKELLENPNYEYLRYNDHPIEWSKYWGIDYNIPPMPVSIEIMVDLINILIMVWHKNVQAWMCCSGKEAVQFIMELLYDWYSLDTSKPNKDYIRAYRWVRWEAEKVYFLNAENGLQAIGILIANLIDYMKYHHFDLVPLWRNPKAMDIERNFNRIVQNGDIMKDLDKLKSSRHYCIETQNFERKNIFGE
ncbi:hypothetical protein K144316041_09380 [Clostridium tetani]|uniref:hypothetical protein n=1 Tax=Clostridium tetani TaxID=1513 RepID=UPI0029551F70|nr:hypothetical protein [Clostridium tetani]BDR72230.1 hypothetical protein K144316041_09380 [Clostridium tetani]